MTGPRTILITGATDGLGQALAHRLTTDGATVLLPGRDQEKLDRTAGELREVRGAGRTQTLRADLADLAQHTARAHRQAYARNARAELWYHSLELTGEPDIATEPDGPG
jgi:short-subunit dehydrogenase